MSVVFYREKWACFTKKGCKEWCVIDKVETGVKPVYCPLNGRPVKFKPILVFCGGTVVEDEE